RWCDVSAVPGQTQGIAGGPGEIVARGVGFLRKTKIRRLAPDRGRSGALFVAEGERSTSKLFVEVGHRGWEEGAELVGGGGVDVAPAAEAQDLRVEPVEQQRGEA